MGFLRSNFQAAESYGARFFSLHYLTPLLPLGKMTKQNFPPPGETLLSCLHCKNIPIFAAVCPSPRPYPAEILTVTLEIKGKLCSATDKTPHASCCASGFSRNHTSSSLSLYGFTVILEAQVDYWTQTFRARFSIYQSLDLIYLTKPCSGLTVLPCANPLLTLKQAPSPSRHVMGYELNANTRSCHLSWHSPKKRSQMTYRFKK